MVIDERQLSYDFVSLLTHNPEYFSQCIVKKEMLAKPYADYFVIIEKSYKENGSFDVVKLDEHGMLDMYRDCDFNGIAIDVKDAFNSYQRRVLENHRDKNIRNLFHRWDLKMLETERFIEALKDVESITSHTLKDLTAEDIIASLMKQDRRIEFSTTRFVGLKEKLKLEQHDLMTVAGGTGSGKSAMALNLMEDLSKHYPCLYFNMEMSKDQLNERLVAIHMKESLDNLDKYRDMNDEYKRNVEFYVNKLLEGRHIKIETGGQNLDSITSNIANHEQSEHFIVFVDHVGLISVPGAKNNVEKVTEVYQKLRKLSLDYNCTIIALCQLNRESTKQSPRPTLSALKDSSEAEQSSSKVCFIYEEDTEYWFDIAKNRNGSKCLMNMLYDKKTQRMEIKKIEG